MGTDKLAALNSGSRFQTLAAFWISWSELPGFDKKKNTEFRKPYYPRWGDFFIFKNSKLKEYTANSRLAEAPLLWTPR